MILPFFDPDAKHLQRVVGICGALKVNVKESTHDFQCGHYGKLGPVAKVGQDQKPSLHPEKSSSL